MIAITQLVANTARGARILGEHGLAWWIETGTHRVLFDTGQGMALRHNAEVLGIDLAAADAVVLSHGHFDHVGGLEAVLPVARRATLYLHPRAVEKKFTGKTTSRTRVDRSSSTAPSPSPTRCSTIRRSSRSPARAWWWCWCWGARMPE